MNRCPVLSASTVVLVCVAAGGCLTNSPDYVALQRLAVRGEWRPAAQMSVYRSSPAAVVLTDGRVLVVGGTAESASTEIYDPVRDIWTQGGALTTIREAPSATLLLDGHVLIVGGETSGAAATAETYDPETTAFEPAGTLEQPLRHHTATLLADGRVLVAGGEAGSTTLGDSVIYDPMTGWSPGATLIQARSGHTATLLRDGRVIVVGGRQGGFIDATYLGGVEGYDPVGNVWTPLAPTIPRAEHTATLLADGTLLVSGGLNLVGALPSGGSLAQVDLYDPVSGAWQSSGVMLEARHDHTATLLPDGRLLIAGGTRQIEDMMFVLETAELYEPAVGVSAATGAMGMARTGHAACLLASAGKVLIVGAAVPSTGAEVYDLGSNATDGGSADSIELDGSESHDDASGIADAMRTDVQGDDRSADAPGACGCRLTNLSMGKSPWLAFLLVWLWAGRNRRGLHSVSVRRVA